MSTNKSYIHKEQVENFQDLMDHALCGYATTDTQGVIILANNKLADWLQIPIEEIKGRKFSDILAVGGRIYYETHLGPLLRMQGHVDEVAVQLLAKNGDRFPVLLNAYERRDEQGQPMFIRLLIIKATDRLKYEANIQEEKRRLASEILDQRDRIKLRDQLIAILGHDLRNPLSSIISGTDFLQQSLQNETDKLLVNIVQRSANRMSELINNIMDFARTRLGTGIVLELSDAKLQPMLQHIVQELHVQFPKRQINFQFHIDEPVFCDGSRICQLFSNLLANALTHGDASAPVEVQAIHQKHHFELSISNQGTPIPQNMIDHIFEPFTREKTRPSHNGLGLGLYIASQISHAHQGTLICTSTVEKTVFLFQMDTSLLKK
ncbi:MAG: PAS domain-containing sensor histidine kinase [Chitinophagaceae bacterium]